MRLAVFCSGGDAPGMNACVRAVARTAIATGHECVGIRRGYAGLLAEDFFPSADPNAAMSARDVSNLIQQGGTFLRTSRSAEYKTSEGVRRAAEILDRHGIEGLIPIGGDGTIRGAIELAEIWSGKIVCCPGTIDNDLKGTDFTIGFSTAVATAVDAVDKLHDTAESHERAILVEVMGRSSGYIALHTAIAAGAEYVCVPETPTDIGDLARQIVKLKQHNKRSLIVIVAEGDEGGGVEAVNAKLASHDCPFKTRTVTLGHIQRGGRPTPDDRLLASRLGSHAVRSLTSGATGVMAGEIGCELALTPLAETIGSHKPLPDELLRLLETLSI